MATTIISDARTGSGPPFVDLQDIALEPDGNLVVVDALLAAVLRVNPLTGDRTLVSRGGVAPATERRAAGNPTPRSLEEFLAAQGTYCIDAGMGGCFDFTPPVPNTLGWGSQRKTACRRGVGSSITPVWLISGSKRLRQVAALLVPSSMGASSKDR